MESHIQWKATSVGLIRQLPGPAFQAKFVWRPSVQSLKHRVNWICSTRNEMPMTTLTRYGLMAEKHWRVFRPKMVRELEAKGTLQEMLFEAQDKTEDEMDEIRRKLI